MKRESFGSRLGFILVSAGCAIGIGNVWKFPYICGEYGGAAFILIYLCFLVILGIPVLVSEFAVGRGSHTSVAKCFDKLAPEGSGWKPLKSIGIIGCYMLMMFYTTVGGWMLYYCVKSLRGDFAGASPEAVTQSFSDMLGNAPTMMLWMVIICLIGFAVCFMGLQNGIEKISKVMMSALLIIMVVLAVHSVMMEGAGEGIRFYLIPDFQKIKDAGIGNVVFAALSQSFFTLSIGIGAMLIFGSYLDKSRSLTGEAVSITILDTFVALTAGFIIIPACFAFGVEPGAGPGLVFITLPNVFNQMTGGKIWGALFFLFMSFASLSTVIAVFENIISYSMDRKGWSRGKAVIVNMVAMILLSLPAVFGFNILSGIQPLGAGTNIMDLEDFIVSNNILPLGSVVFVMFCVSKYGWGWKRFIKEADTGEGLKFPANVQKYMLYVIPAIVVVIYLKGYYDMFSPKGPVVLTVWMIVSLLVLGLVGWIIFGKNKTK